jgi:hypothetical protein
MDERKRQSREDERPDDELKLPEDRVEDLELDEDQSADVAGGLNYSKIENEGGGS